MKNSTTYIHFLSAFVTVVLDWLWLTFELPATLSGVGLVLTGIGLGVLCSIIVTLIQHFVADDEWGAAAAKGMVMGVVAGVPYPVVSTVIGVPLLAWSGIKTLKENNIILKDNPDV